jgi:membrane-associated phospholipid phosphatase
MPRSQVHHQVEIPIGWAGARGIVLSVGLDRIYVGAHWPSDVLAGMLIATAWLTFVLSVRWISDRSFAARAKGRPDAGQSRFLNRQALNVPIPIPALPARA